MFTRVCRICNEENLLNKFPVALIKAGRTYYRHSCKNCYSKEKLEAARKRIEKFREFKKTLSCNRCGYSDYRALQFHHNNQEKDGNISEMVRRRSWDVIMNEVSKCEVLCANCHQIEHYYEA